MRYRFNGFEVDTLQFKLLFSAKTLALEPKTFDLLVYLIKNRNRPVTRDELFSNVWQGQVVGDATLSNHINSVRKILGDNGNEQKIIATLRGRGYQFIAVTEQVDSPDSIIPVHFFAKHKRFLHLLGIISILLFAALLVNHSLKNELGMDKTLRIAVLPFNNVKVDPTTNYLGFAIADQIIGSIAYMEQVTVRASASVRKYEMQYVDPIEVGKELNVEYILTGNYLQLPEFLRINFELIEVGSNNLLWRETIQSKSGGSFKLHTQIVQTIARQLNIHLSSSHKNRMSMDIPASAQAYHFYLRAIAYPITVEGSKLAILMSEKSVELDGGFAPTYVELGYRTNYLAVYNLMPSSAKEKAIEYYKKAISLNPESRNALSGLADIYTETGKTGKAVELLRKLISLKPSDAQAHFSLGYSYRFAGMSQEAVDEMELALVLDPGNPKFRSIGLTYDNVGEYDKALSVLTTFEGSVAALAFKQTILIHMGRTDEALAGANHIISLESNSFWHNDAVIQRAIITGDVEAGFQALKELEAADINDAETNFYWARYYAVLGDKKGCFRLLRRAVNNGYFNYPFMLSEPFYFDSVRQDPEFKELLARVKKKHLDFKLKYF